MINTQKQTGGVHAVIIVVIVFLILGALGFVFWQNFINKSPQLEPVVTESKPAKEDTTVKAEQLTELYTIPSEGLIFNYPKTWSVTSLNDQSAGGNRTLLVSPDNFALQVYIPSEGPNWPFGERPLPCPFDKEYNGYQGGEDNHPDACPFYHQIALIQSPNLDGLSAIAFKATWEDSKTMPDATTLLLVKTGCQIPEQNFCERPAAKTGYFLDITGQYYKKISDQEKKTAFIDPGSLNRKQIDDNDFIRSQDVLTAIDIMKSMRY